MTINWAGRGLLASYFLAQAMWDPTHRYPALLFALIGFAAAYKAAQPRLR